MAVGPYEILPWRHDLSVSGDPVVDSQVAAMLAAYRVGEMADPEATLLRRKGDSVIDELDEHAISDAFRFSELLAFAGLSTRSYFGHFGYQNRDNFRLIVQRFGKAPGVTIVSRRRDGHTQNFHPEESYRNLLPAHVGIGQNCFDRMFLEALMSAQPAKSWDSIYEAIISFSLGNTDNAEVAEHIELVLLVSALERLLDCRAGQEAQLVDAFASLFSPSHPLPRSDCLILNSEATKNTYPKAKSVREIWIRDAFRLRSKFAHGTISSNPPIWSLKSHLLLGAFLFPILVKLDLSRKRFYTLTENDEESVEAFEYLLNEELFQVSKSGPAGEFPWKVALSRFQNDSSARRFRELFKG